MFVRVTKSPTSVHSKVYLVEGYRDSQGKSKQRIVKCYGNLDELEKEDPNILEKLKAEAKRIPRSQIQLNLNLLTSNQDASPSLNYGYFFLDAVFKELNLHTFFSSLNKKFKISYDIFEVVRLLTFSRFLKPSSKLETVSKQSHFFEPFQLSLDDVYRSLDKLYDCKDKLQLYLHKEICKKYERDCSLVFYDVTNYYFETEIEDALKKVGMSKERRKSPIVQMGLFIDNQGIPIAYKLFPGNTHDSKTLIPILKEMKKEYGFGKMIVTADKGLNSGQNLTHIQNEGDGYIVSQKIRGSSKEFIDQILHDDYQYNAERTFKIKSFLRERQTKDKDGKKVCLKENVICFWSKNFDDREKVKRVELEKRIDDLVNHPAKFKASNAVGIKKYLKVSQLDKETGEIKNYQPIISFNKEKYDRDLALDGYYALVTNELDLKPEEVIERYRGLWKIEESFRVIKSDLEGRPVYVRKEAVCGRIKVQKIAT